MTRDKNSVKVTFLIFKENSYYVRSGKGGVFEPKNAKIRKIYKICSLDFNEILCDDEVKVTGFSFQGNVDYAQRTPLWMVLGTKLTRFSFVRNMFI